MTINQRKALHAFNSRPRLPSMETITQVLAVIATAAMIAILYLEA